MDKTFGVGAHLQNILEFRLHRKENTILCHDKNQVVNAV
jgi:hypothetical protein